MEGTDNHMIHSLLWYFQSLLLFLGLLGLLSVGTLIVRTRLKRKSENENENESLRKFWTELNTDIKITSRLLCVLMGVVVSFAAGYIVREHELNINSIPYIDVAIKSPSLPDTDFDIQPARMQPIPSKLCFYTVDWKVGEVLKDLTFEQRPGCKRIISYHRYDKGEVNASIQMR